VISDVVQDVPNALIVVAAVVTAVGIIWRKVVTPVRGWFHSFKAWMERIEHGMTWVEAQMKPNGGGSLVDKVNMLLEHDAERDTAGHRYGPESPDTKENP
jgi:hypothetical protein